jgi:hypothetical protein
VPDGKRAVSEPSRLRTVKPGLLALWCPGCMTEHQIDVHALNQDGKVVGWDGAHDRPTLGQTVSFPGCQFLLRGGVLHFFACAHPLSNQDVPLPHFPLP